MLRDYFLAGVADVEMFSGTELIGTAKTLVDSTIEVSTSNEEIRVGRGAKLAGRYFHTSSMTVNIMDGMFRLGYIANQVGSVVSIGGETIADETITVSVAGQVTVVGTPTTFGKETIGWVTLAGQDDWTKVSYSGKVFTVAGATIGQTYCVKYNTSNDAMKQVVVSGNIVPNELKMILKADLFLGQKSDISTASKVGYVEIEIPRVQLDGGFSLNLTMSGASQTPMAGMALVNTDDTTCETGGYYAIIKEVLNSANWYDTLIDLAIEGGTLVPTNQVVTRGIFSGSYTKIIDPTLLTYTGTNCTVNATGLISAVASAGNVKVTVKGTGLPTNISAITGVALTATA